MTTLTAIVVGLMMGTHTATWGMFKDSPHEGFTWLRYSRSIYLGALLALGAQMVLRFDLSTPGGLLVLFGLTYVLERIVVEFYKTFVREEDQSKYFIPMQFAVKGKVVQDRKKRWFAAAIVVGMAFALLAGVIILNIFVPEPPTILLVLVGSLGGWFSAMGGAWKDAPLEGFEWPKFFRSPVVAAFYAFLLSHFTRSYFIIPLAALGFTIATLETYKTFFFPSKPRGKFQGKPVWHPHMLRSRWWFVPVYAGIWVCIISAFVVGLS